MEEDIRWKQPVNKASSGLSGDFDDSDMPYFVDVSIYDKLSNADLKAHIDRVGKVLYSARTIGEV